ncbi:MAG TPA: CDP-alcohol phosphatidyltransferase family protein [Dehalococcoidia bacterium]|jgi:CDP-diacylglycerol--glycerol-3-phosphate 3-phosphatidyltransferase|nr:CDP-alcohol phosphatidyltransferase family protein [Dehalococcoidia bacterium]
MAKLAEIRENASHYLTQPVVRLLTRTAITPNALTWLGFLISLGAAALIITGHLFAAGFVVLVAGLFDMLDGALARHISRTTRFGAILDSTLDRITEAVLLLSILVLYAREPSTIGIILVGIALPGSLLVSYIRARAEAAGLECKVGLFTRAERVIILALGLLLSQMGYALLIALGIIALFSFFTAGQRLLYVWRQVRTD